MRVRLANLFRSIAHRLDPAKPPVEYHFHIEPKPQPGWTCEAYILAEACNRVGRRR